MGLVRQVRMGTATKFVFVPADDSVVIGATRYMVSVIELEALDFDPSTRPYPPAAWPKSRFWQFANKHVPYIDVGYSGETQRDRIAQAQKDATRIGADVSARREPMHLYLDTDRELMTHLADLRLPVRSVYANGGHRKSSARSRIPCLS